LVQSTGLIWTTLILVGALLLYGGLVFGGCFVLRRWTGYVLIVFFFLYTAFEITVEIRGGHSG